MSKVTMSFSDALQQMKVGDRLTRQGWNGKGLFVEAQFPDANSKMGNPYLYIDAKALGGERNPWVPSQTDLFAEDWEFVEREANADSAAGDANGTKPPETTGTDTSDPLNQRQPGAADPTPAADKPTDGMDSTDKPA
jgi:hypothetical protein